MVQSKVGALHRVEEVPACAVRLRPARRVGERQEDPAAVALEPVQLELAEREPRDGEAAERKPSISTRCSSTGSTPARKRSSGS